MSNKNAGNGHNDDLSIPKSEIVVPTNHEELPDFLVGLARNTLLNYQLAHLGMETQDEALTAQSEEILKSFGISIGGTSVAYSSSKESE